MEKFTAQGPAVQDKDPKKSIRGTVILGNIDPRTMTEEEFNSSPDALFHGFNSNYFKYTPVYDYDSEEYFENTDGSATLGQGLYVTDSRAEAEKYSKMRKSRKIGEQGSKIEASVEVFVPYKAKMLDLRMDLDPSENGHFPKQLAEVWKKYYESYYAHILKIIESSNKKDGKEIIPDSIFSTYVFYYKAGIFEKYKNLIDEVIESDRLDLRYLLGTAGNDSFKNNIGSAFHSPPWITLFSSFIKKAGFDGLIYIESGDDDHFERTPSFVFYNLDRVGNYQSWKSGKHKVE